ncbi:hypothetical protein [Saccharopolyspora sp. NPDC050642]|uniref:hypothetical protein n=1 Tax=Saccharopolyspora sp. NPDC050642 TaxID=3157099 RepID=UPI00340AAEAD
MSSAGRGSNRAITVGVVADPGVPTEIAHRIADGLPGEFRARVDQDLDWSVEVRSEALSLSEDGRIDIAGKAQEKKSSEGWDLLVCLTDLPRRDATRPVVAEVDTDNGVGLASLPAIGWIRLRPYVRDVVVHLVGLLARETLKLTDSRPAGGHHHARRWGWPGSQIRQVPAGNDHADVTLVLPGVRGRLRLLFGMVRDNRPWRLVPELSRAIAAATATAAFGIFFPTIWSLADNLSVVRLVLINLVAVFAMVTWITLHNGLWERPRNSEDRNKVVLYNAATLITLTIGVACMYALLFVITLIGSTAVISVDYLGKQLGHAAAFIDYVSLSWLASSMGTVAGALGSSLETETAVRRATYSRRERERRARRRRESREQD